MKTKSLFFLFPCILLTGFQLFGQPPTVTLTTPKGSTFYGYQTPEIYDYQDKLDWGAAYAAAYQNCTEQGTATTTNTYNCHSYAWNKSEGGPICWIGYNSTSEEDIYWTDNSYIETTEANATKISYYADDHSARQSATPGWYISKWGNKVLMLHAKDDGPAEYLMSSRRYYRLNPFVTGSITLMCAGNQRTYGISGSIPGSTYSWSRETSLFNQVSATNTAASYTVSATSSTGNAWVAVQITTPSGAVATTPYFYAWVGKAQVQSISGPSSVSRNIQYMYYANANNSSGTSYNWSVSPSGPYLSPSGGEVSSCGATFYSSGSYQLLARAVNSCGTSTWCPKSVYVGGGKMLSLFPNPATDNVSITVNEDPQIEIASDSELANTSTSTSISNEPKTYTIRIYNSQSALLSTTIRSGKIFNVPLTNMRDGTYIIEVSEGNNRYTQQLIVKHN